MRLRGILLFRCMRCATESAFQLFVKDDDLVNYVYVMVLWVQELGTLVEFSRVFDFNYSSFLYSPIYASRKISVSEL